MEDGDHMILKLKKKRLHDLAAQVSNDRIGLRDRAAQRSNMSLKLLRSRHSVENVRAHL